MEEACYILPVQMGIVGDISRCWVIWYLGFVVRVTCILSMLFIIIPLIRSLQLAVIDARNTCVPQIVGSCLEGCVCGLEGMSR